MVADLQPRFNNPNTFSGAPGLDPYDPNSATPPTPLSVKLQVLANGTWRITWSGLFFRQTINGVPPALGSWNVGFCTEALAGPQSNNASWAANVKSCADVLGVLAAGSSSNGYSYFQSDTSRGDGWALVWASSANGSEGKPSSPLHVTVSTTSGAIPSDPNVSSAQRLVQQVPLKDNANNVYVFNHTIDWTPPPDVSQFQGMSMFVQGINGDNAIADVQEISSLCPWDHTTGTQEYSFVTPEDTGVQTNTVTMTNGSAVMLRTGGSNFVIGNVGHQIAIYGASASDFVSVYTAQISAFTDASHQNIGSVFTGLTGSYTVKTYNAWTYYLNSVSLIGNHRPDPLSTSAFFTK